MDAGLMHADVATVRPGGLRENTQVPHLQDGALRWQVTGPAGDAQVVRAASAPFSASGGLRLLTGNLGRSVIKVSAVPEDRHIIEAPARVFDSQEALLQAFTAGELAQACRDTGAGGLICVVRWQGPRANGMPELHKLTPPLAVLQGEGWRVALVTDGRMSGASGKVPAAIHVSPEAAAGGPLARLRDGDLVRLDATAGTLQALVEPAEWEARMPATMPARLQAANQVGLGRDLFVNFRRNALTAEEGACTWL
jgi:phosphogluconate dehydratase